MSLITLRGSIHLRAAVPPLVKAHIGFILLLIHEGHPTLMTIRTIIRLKFRTLMTGITPLRQKAPTSQYPGLLQAVAFITPTCLPHLIRSLPDNSTSIPLRRRQRRRSHQLAWPFPQLPHPPSRRRRPQPQVIPHLRTHAVFMAY